MGYKNSREEKNYLQGSIKNSLWTKEKLSPSKLRISSDKILNAEALFQTPLNGSTAK
jgi:hypothetical protein